MDKEEAVKLLQNDIDRRHYSVKTKENYVTYLVQLLSYYDKRDPSTITLDEISDFISSLETTKSRSPQTISLAVNSLSFFYTKVLKLDYEFKRISYKKRRFIGFPNILEPDEILRLLDSIDNLKNKAMITMLYSSGLTINQTISIEPGI
jgi:integrase/recombinase XerD